MTSPTASAAHPALPPAERFARRIAALPDAITAGFFLLLWIVPQWLGPAALRTGLPPGVEVVEPQVMEPISF